MASTRPCNGALYDCMNHCQGDGVLDSEDVCRAVIWGAMDLIAGSWCCGRPCPPEVYWGEAADGMHKKAEGAKDRVYGRVRPVVQGAKQVFSMGSSMWSSWGTKADEPEDPPSVQL